MKGKKNGSESAPHRHHALSGLQDAIFGHRPREYRPRPDEPKIWFESVRSMAQVLSNENQLLLKTILERKPESLKELEAATGRSSSNLSRTLKTMARYGIVRMERCAGISGRLSKQRISRFSSVCTLLLAKKMAQAP